MRAQPDLLDHVYNYIDFLRSSAGFHDNQHMVTASGYLFSLVQTPDSRLREERKSASRRETVAFYRQATSASAKACGLRGSVE
jgi:hypothetical protein